MNSSKVDGRKGAVQFEKHSRRAREAKLQSELHADGLKHLCDRLTISQTSSTFTTSHVEQATIYQVYSVCHPPLL